MRHHVLISGTGRAGTSFLVQLLTNLGLNTGYTAGSFALDPIARAGLEFDARDANAPYIVKSPWICDYIEELLGDESVHVDHVIIPVRNFEAAAASRAHVQKINTGIEDGAAPVPGGLWHTDKAVDQVGVLQQRFTRLVEQLVRHDVNMTFIWYPRLAQDAAYLRSKLANALPMPDAKTFDDVFAKTIRPDWVNKFSDADGTAPNRASRGGQKLPGRSGALGHLLRRWLPR